MTLSDDLTKKVSDILSKQWDTREGKVVPSTEDVAQTSGAVKLDATVLYVDLVQSSRLGTDFQQRTAARVIQSFLYCMCRLVESHDGTITSFDGDRIMGIFLGGYKNTNAAKCALKMKYVTEDIIKPKLKNHFTSLKKDGYNISHCVGIDTSPILAVRAGKRGSNDLVWVGRAPNLAAKLSEIRNPPYLTYISEEVFLKLNDEAKYGDGQKTCMWEKRSYPFVGEDIIIYRSNWKWPI